MKEIIEHPTRAQSGNRFGRARVQNGDGLVEIREDLWWPLAMFVLIHELWHVRDYRNGVDQWWVWMEVRANAMALAACILGPLLTVMMSLSPGRLRFYWKRWRAGK